MIESSNQRFKKPAPSGNIYRRPTGHVEYQIFNEDYFSGADVNLFFGDIWIDEAISLGFSVQESVLPVYGYASYTFDTTVRGQRIVNGQFGINFKHPSYLKQVLENAGAIQYAVQSAQAEGVVKPEDFKKYKLDEIMKMYGKESFDQLADEYEQALWGVAEDNQDFLSNSSQTFFPSYGFDIRINYGAVTEAMEKDRSKYYTSAVRMQPNITVETVNGVQLTGMTKQGISTASQGAPITEIYSFIAKDINAPFYQS